jgi:hypothetical protein
MTRVRQVEVGIAFCVIAASRNPALASAAGELAARFADVRPSRQRESAARCLRIPGYRSVWGATKRVSKPVSESSVSTSEFVARDRFGPKPREPPDLPRPYPRRLPEIG